jgi:nicotinamidase-related amidase
LSTALAAADVDLELTVLADACFDGSGLAAHELLVDERFPTIAEVMTADQWIVRSIEPR